MADEIIIEKPKPERIIKEIELTDIPVITKRKIDSENIRFAFDQQTKKISIEFNFETQYDGDTPPQIDRKHMLVRDLDYDYAFDALFPNDDAVIWTNPQQTFLTSILNLIKSKL